MDWQTAQEWAAQHGDAFYVFDEALFVDNFRRLSAAFTTHYAPTRIAYSYKTNYTPDICRLVDSLGGYAEVVSEMEYALARRLGVQPTRIVYNGPCKSPPSLREALLGGSLVNLDSLRDVDLASAVAAEASGRQLAVALRCNFPISGLPLSRFGMDVDGDEFRTAIDRITAAPGLRLAGIHCHFPNRDLASYIERTERMLVLARTIFPCPPDFINLGGGYFSSIPASIRRTMREDPPRFEDYGHAIGSRFAAAYPVGAGPRPTLIIEPGTAVVADTVRFIARVLHVKHIRERAIATVAGSIFNISPSARSINLPTEVLSGPGPRPPGTDFDVAGYTCIEGDYLSKGLRGPVAPGDFIAYGNAGSYSIVMKPPFILPNAAILAVGKDGSCQVLRPRETTEDIFRLYAGFQ